MSDIYKKAGVDLKAGYEAVARIKKHVKRTDRPGVCGGIGGFGGLFDLGGLGFRDPILVSGTDSVGTKVMIAFLMDKHDTIGIDVVAMCADDVVVQGAEPLFFLDYIGCGQAKPAQLEAIVAGVAEGCVQAGCALVGGEIAELPGLYKPDEYDLVGFAVGACERTDLIDGSKIQANDILLGLASSGLHSNGFSLVRKLVFQDAKMKVADYVADLGCTLGEELLRPTMIYARPLLSALRHCKIKGIAHITGGGLIENIPRMLPEGLGASIDERSLRPQPIFDLLQKVGELTRQEMYNVFNMGVGMVLAVEEEQAQAAADHLNEQGLSASFLGQVVAGSGVVFHD